MSAKCPRKGKLNSLCQSQKAAVTFTCWPAGPNSSPHMFENQDSYLRRGIFSFFLGERFATFVQTKTSFSRNLLLFLSYQVQIPVLVRGTKTPTSNYHQRLFAITETGHNCLQFPTRTRKDIWVTILSSWPETPHPLPLHKCIPTWVI